MSDISMCHWTNCPLKETCYRYKAPKWDYQCFFTEIHEKDWKCEYYWDIQADNKEIFDDDKC